MDKQGVIRSNRDTLYSMAVVRSRRRTGDDYPAGRRQAFQVDAGDQRGSLHRRRRSRIGAGNYTLRQGTRSARVTSDRDPDAGRSRRSQGCREGPRRSRTPSRSARRPPGKFEIPNWDPAQSEEGAGCPARAGFDRGEFKNAFGAKGQVDPVRHLIGNRRGLGRQSGQGRDLSQRRAGEERRQDGLQADRSRQRAGRRLLVDQPLQRRGLFREEPYNAYSLNNLTAKRNR